MGYRRARTRVAVASRGRPTGAMMTRRWLSLVAATVALVLGVGALPAAAEETPSTTVHGTVTDRNGAPLADVTVSLSPTTCVGHGEPCPYYSAKTDGSGAYTITGVLARAYFAFADAGRSGYVGTYYREDSAYAASSYGVSDAVGPSQASIDFKLFLGAAVSGVLTDHSGAPLAGVTVQAPARQTAVTGSDGSYNLVGVPAGEVELLASGTDLLATKSAPITTDWGQNVTGVNWIVDRGSVVSGTVRDPEGNPVSNAHVTFDDADSAYDWTGSDGHFSVRVRSGSVKMRVARDPFSPAESALTLVDGQPYNADIRLRPAGELAVALVAQANPSAAINDIGYSVELVSTADQAKSYYFAVKAGHSSENLRVPEGTYSVTVTADTAPNTKHTKVITVASGKATAWRVELRGASVHGIVYDSLGRPVEGVTLTAPGGITAKSEFEGNFWIDFPRAGSYTLTAAGAGGQSGTLTLTIVDGRDQSGHQLYMQAPELRSFKAAKPTIKGKVKVGRVLTAKCGTWKPRPTFTYQWKRNGKKIKGATSATYRLVAADRGARITVTVTGKKAGYTTVAKTSSRTVRVAK